MIQNIQIKDFQSHKDSQLTLDSGVNVVIGSSDCGKSSIIRAIKWVAQNRPQGDSFRNNQLKPKEEVRVDLTFKEGPTVSRLKSSKTNSYIIGKKELKALRSDVPEEVKELTRIKEVNLQSQHPSDQYFLLTDSPGQVAKKFNEVVGLEIMDKAMYSINSKVRENNQQLKIYDDEILNKKTELQKLKWVLGAKEKALQIEEIEEDTETQQNKKEQLESLLLLITEVQNNLKKYNGVNQAIKKIKNLIIQEEQIQKLEKKNNTINHLIDFIKNTTEENTKYQYLSQALKEINNLIIQEKEIQVTKNRRNIIDTVVNCVIKADTQVREYQYIPEAITSLKSLQNMVKIITEKKRKTKQIQTELFSIRKKAIIKKEIDKKLLEKQTAFTELLKTNQCPICGRK